MELRPYQKQAVESIFQEWDQGHRKTLLVLATGLGKTIVFCNVIKKLVESGEKVLILAHRKELLDQASDKLKKTTGLDTALEKAEFSCLDEPATPVVVGSVQTLQSPKRLSQFRRNYFDTIVIDEAHHALSDGYQRVLEHFDQAKILGVTATPDRGDKRNLGKVFDSIAFEYSIAQGIRDGYLSKIRALTIPLDIDISGVSQSSGDFSAGELGEALDPYLEAIADKMTEYCRDRKTIAFLPLIATSRKFKEILNHKGFHAEEISGTDFPEARQRKLRDFEEGRTNVLCNSMLLTEGFDCPSIDCVICLRPTKIRALYTQIVGRGTRLAPCKEYVLLLDFLWHSERMELCHPAHLISDDAKVQKRMTEILEDKADDPMLIEGLDIQELEVEAESDVVRQREAALAEHLRELKTRKSKFVDPLQWEMSISSNDLASYEETFAWELKPMTDKQKASLEKWGINPDEVETCGKARLILDKLQKRREAGLTTPKQIRMLERKGFQRVGEWQFSEASKLIDEIAQNGWRVPYSFGRPADYVPLSMRSKASTPAPQSAWQDRARTAINW